MTTSDTSGAPTASGSMRGQRRRAVFASVVGTTIEWYDYCLSRHLSVL